MKRANSDVREGNSPASPRKLLPWNLVVDAAAAVAVVADDETANYADNADSAKWKEHPAEAEQQRNSKAERNPASTKQEEQ